MTFGLGCSEEARATTTTTTATTTAKAKYRHPFDCVAQDDVQFWGLKRTGKTTATAKATAITTATANTGILRSAQNDKRLK
jgi:hypothetical protein